MVLSMTIEEFAHMVQYKDQERQLSKYFDEHLALYALVCEVVKDKAIVIDFREDKSGCQYMLSPVNSNVDLSYMEAFYNKVNFNLCAHHYQAEVKFSRGKVGIRFIDIRGMA